MSVEIFRLLRHECSFVTEVFLQLVKDPWQVLLDRLPLGVHPYPKKTINVLMILRLNNNKINNEGIKYISSSLNVSHLTELDLSLNNISDQGAINLFEAASFQ